MFKFFTNDLRRNLIKIICLTVGLSVGFLLVAKIYFEQTYDTFFTDIDRIYRLTESVVQNGEYREYPNVPAGMAKEISRNLPQVEEATTITHLTGNTTIKLDDGRLFEVKEILLADTSFFNLLDTRIIEGDPRIAMGIENQVMIPRSLADKIGGDVMGLQLVNIGFTDDIKMTIAGVYEDYPLNSTIPNGIYMSMASCEKIGWGSTENLLGNESFEGYVKLAKGVKPEEMHGPIINMLKKKLPDMVFDISDYRIWLRPLKGFYSSRDVVKTMSWMLGMLATVMIMCAGLNYLLIVIGQLTGRSKEMAVRKCYGTGRRQIFIRVMGESLFFLLVSLGLAILIAFSLSGLCKELLGYTPQQLFSTGKVWIVEGAVCSGLLVVTGVLPSIMYCRTPVANAFRPANHGRRIWKLALLAIQFFASGLLVCLLLLTGRQYAMVGNLPLGYDYENIGIFMQNDLEWERVNTIRKELGKLPFVEGTATYVRDFTDLGGANNVWTEGQFDNQVNVADLGVANPELIDVMGIKIVQGRNFREESDTTSNEVLVDERFIDIMQKYFSMEDRDVVGKTIYMTGHSNDMRAPLPLNIVGVFENMRRGGFETESADQRAAVLFPTSWTLGWVYVRFTELTPENLKAAQKVIDSLSEGHEIYITPYKTRIEALREPIKRFGTSVLVVGIAIIIIALIGLIGYVADEVNRRSKEIAIRKVNGTSASKILQLFCLDILRVALPSVILGGVAAILIGQRWLSQFTDRVSLNPLGMVVALILLLFLILAIVIYNCMRVAHSNPVDHLRSE